MIRRICKDLFILQQKAVPASETDAQLVQDLLDTLKANADKCVGMACNMIGFPKAIIVVAAGPFQIAMINPVITKKRGSFKTEEGCLSLEGVRPCTRYKEIEVDYLDENFKKQHGIYSGFTAQIIQHECDHLDDGNEYGFCTYCGTKIQLAERVNVHVTHEYTGDVPHSTTNNTTNNSTVTNQYY